MHLVREIRSACEMRCGALGDLFHFTLRPVGAIFHNSRSELFHIRRKPNISLKNATICECKERSDVLASSRASTQG